MKDGLPSGVTSPAVTHRSWMCSSSISIRYQVTLRRSTHRDRWLWCCKCDVSLTSYPKRCPQSSPCSRGAPHCSVAMQQLGPSASHCSAVHVWASIVEKAMITWLWAESSVILGLLKMFTQICAGWHLLLLLQNDAAPLSTASLNPPDPDKQVILTPIIC